MEKGVIFSQDCVNLPGHAFRDLKSIFKENGVVLSKFTQILQTQTIFILDKYQMNY